MIDESKIPFGDRYAASVAMVLRQILGANVFEIVFGSLQRKRLARLESRLKATPPARTQAVDRREGLTAKEFREEYFDRSRPVIFSGAAKSWPCCAKWNLEYFCTDYGDKDLLLVNAPGLTSHEENTDYQFLTVNELITDIRNGGEKYLRFSPLLHESPALTADLDLKWLAGMRGGKTFGNTYYLFIGGAKRKTLLHADQPCNLYVQAYGEKRWTLFLPEDSVCLYPQSTNTAYVRSPLDLDCIDHAAYPLFKYARPFEAVLRPGDVLYVPPHVWHQVENLTGTVAVGYRFSSLKAALGSSFSFSLLRLLSTNPPIWKTRMYGQLDTNLIWAHASGKIKEVLRQRKLRREAGPDRRSL
jgi:hypothetical protein